jgi:CubicO group peptidase (beta-lactamase class C family)
VRPRCISPAIIVLTAAGCVQLDGVAGPDEVSDAELAPASGTSAAGTSYYPPSESSGGWRRLVPPNTTPSSQQKRDVRTIAGLDWDVLKQAWDGSRQYGGSLLVIRNGWIAAEWGTTSALPPASCTKTFAALAIHRMFELSARGALPSINHESFAYNFLPASWGKNATRRTIRIRHLLTMSSGLEPFDRPPPPSEGTGSYLQRMLAPAVRTAPGKEWSYASLPVDVLSVVTTRVTGRKLGEFFQQEIGSKIGVRSLRWGTLGPYSYASAYSSVTARDLARIMYLLLRGGMWNGTSLVSGKPIDAMTRWASELESAVYGPQIQFPTDPRSHLRYGRLTWTNRGGSSFVGSGVPEDAYYCAGFRTNFATVLPSLALLIVRLQSGPTPWSDGVFKTINSKVVSAVVGAGDPEAEATSAVASIEGRN